MWIKTHQNRIPRSTRITSAGLCRLNMLHLALKHNAGRHLLLQLQLEVRERELVLVAKDQWKFQQVSQHGESYQPRSHCLKIPQEKLDIKKDGQRVRVNNKAWPLHRDLDENHLGLLPMLTTYQATLHLLSPLLDLILVAQ